MRFAITNIETGQANLLMNDYVAGLPSPLTSLGFAEAIVRQLDLKPWSARVLPVIHAVQPSEGRTRPEYTNDGGRFAPTEMPEDMKGHVDISLIVELDDCDSEVAVLNCARSLRFAGGVIEGSIGVTTVSDDASALGKLPRGFAMVPATAYREVTSFGEPGGFEKIGGIVFPEAKGARPGWIVPVAIGYRLLEDPETVPRRRGTRRSDIPHVFAEPGIGLAELISIRSKRLLNLNSDEFTKRMWRWDARGNLVLGHSDYHAA